MLHITDLSVFFGWGATALQLSTKNNSLTGTFKHPLAFPEQESVKWICLWGLAHQGQTCSRDRSSDHLVDASRNKYLCYSISIALLAGLVFVYRWTLTSVTAAGQLIEIKQHRAAYFQRHIYDVSVSKLSFNAFIRACTRKLTSCVLWIWQLPLYLLQNRVGE